jgi:prepilin-type N-terminal cleavage/methylation domain-containing protein
MSSNARQPRAGTTLVELLVAIAVGAIVVAVVAAFSQSATMSLARMLNYAEMAAASQTTVDQLTRDARRANRVINATAMWIVFEDFDGVALIYSYNARQGTLTRTKNMTSTVLLKGCDVLTFTLGKRNPAGAFEDFPAATAAECKVVSVAWQCSRTILGYKTTTENLSSAKIVIRR